MVCVKCLLELPTDGDYAVCGKKGCTNAFHFDCTTVSGSSWRSMGPDRKADWRCVPCKEEKARRLETKSQESSLSGKSPRDNKDKDKEWTTKEVMEKFDNKMDTWEATITKILKSSEEKASKKFVEFEKALSYYGDKVDDAHDTVKKLEQKIVLLEKRVQKSENENQEMKTRMRNMEIQLNEREQKDYNNQVEIVGVKDKNCNAEQVFSKIMDKAGFTSGEIQFKTEKYTTKGGDGRPEKTSIKVMFRSQDDRNKVLTKIKREKVYTKLENSVNSDSSPISVNESLCPYYKKLFFEAKRIKREKNFAFLWTKDGRILLKKTVDSNTIRLSCMDDLGKI
uniref:PHD-type domain-containing protein n=1 Tax=Cacopsylla melanoneura TaxID=428564 RepID=A0A8D9E5F7_9HEMI